MSENFSRRGFVLAFAVYSLSLLRPTAVLLAANGSFKGRIVAEWLPDGRSMKLAEGLEYIDPASRAWPVPAGIVVDGASIPSVFWSVIGGPFEGLYRVPSVVHDYYCDHRVRKAADVHKVFYDAMLSAGVGAKKAWLMYQAVNRFGPQWDDPHIEADCELVTDDYDFEKCARNSVPPLMQPTLSRDDLFSFAKEMEGQADATDLSKLKAAIEEAG